MVWLPLLLVVALDGDALAAAEQQTFEVETDATLRSLLADAEDQLARGDAPAAYDRLSPQEARYAGNPLYDYLLGVAALDSRRLGEAILSLQRALTVAPDFSGARLELARAYFDAGQPDRARPLFERTLEEQPPPAVREVITRYLLAIEAKPPSPQGRFLPYAELVTGYDSNANGSTADEQFMGFTLSDANTRESSAFAEIGAGFDWFLPRSNRFGWQFSTRLGHRYNPDAPFVDATVVSGSGGFGWRRGAWFGQASLNAYQGARDGNSNESFVGADMAVGRRVGQHWDVSLAMQGGAQRFDDSIEILDVNRLLYSLNVVRRFAGGSRVVLAGLGGNDNERVVGSPYGNQKSGLRLSLHVPVDSSTRLLATIGTLRTDYDGAFFGQARDDRQLHANVELEFRDVWVAGLTLSPRFRYTDNDSDIALYNYDRSEIGISFKWTRQ